MKAKKICVCLIMISILPIGLVGQNKIHGKVTDGVLPLTGVNVIVLKKHSGYLAGTVTDSNGSYTIDDLKQDNYQLIFSMIGYAKNSLEINMKQEEMQLEDIIMKTEALQMQEVAVKARRTAFRTEPGKITVDLSLASLGSDGSLLSSLGKIPGIVILNDGTVLLNGQTGAKVMIDDKLTYLSGENLVNMLRSIPSSAVDKIEMVSQPSAQYDAGASGGFINIRRKKKTDSGVNLVLSSNAEAGRNFRQNQTISLGLHQKKYSFYTDYSFYSGTDFMLIESSREYFNNQVSHTGQIRLDMDADRQFCSVSHYFKTGMEYEFSKKLTVGLYINGNWFSRGKSEIAQSQFFRNNSPDDLLLQTNNNQNVERTTIESGFNLIYKFNPKIKWENFLSSLTFIEDEKLNQESGTNEPSSENLLQGKMNGDIYILNLQSDLTYSISDRFTLLSGIKSSAITIDNSALYTSLQSGIWQRDEKLSSSFFYQENILAGYIQANQRWSPRFSTQAGLRFEYTGTESGFSSGELNRSYSQYFPSFSASYSFTEKHTVSLQYGKRIIRPNYRYLNPFIEVNDRYLQERGNTGLNPEIVNNFEISWFTKSKYVFGLFYTLRENPITKSYITQPESEATIVMPLNLKQSYAVGFRAGLNNIKPTAYWILHFNGSLTYKQFDWFEGKVQYDNSLFTPTVQISNQLTLPHKWEFEVTGFFNGKMSEGQAQIGSFGSVSLGARKSFLEKKLSFYFYINDIFSTNRQKINLRNSVIAGTYRERRDSSMAGVTIAWKFDSGEELKKIRKASEMEESKRMNL